MMAAENECVRCGATDDLEHGIVVGAVSDINETVCNVCRAEELIDGTVFKRRQAEVYALLEHGYADDRVGEFLGISPSTVASHRSDMQKAIRDARRTLDWVEDGRLRA